MSRRRWSIREQQFEAVSEQVDGIWTATVVELDTKNEPVRFGPKVVESEKEGEKLCKAFLDELSTQKLVR